MNRASIALAGATAVLLVAAPAGAYVRYTSDAGRMFKWPQSCVPLTTFPADLESMMTREEILTAIVSSAEAWSKYNNPCAYLGITVTSSSDEPPRATNDGRNLVVFRADRWCKLTAAGDCDAMIHYDPAALALTSVSASTSSGTIRDADIEVNAFHFSWADLLRHPELRGNGQPYHDLQNAVTHEMGHLIGLDHTCALTGIPPLDHTGAQIPDCSVASPSVLETTMFPSANPGDIDKRTLAPDDQLAVCDIYPVAQDPLVCMPEAPPSEGCSSCAVGPARSAAAGGGGLLLAAALLAIRMRRRRR
jgi:MYXO-CTERM domain-containing protein